MKLQKLATHRNTRNESQAKTLAAIIFALLASAFIVSTSNADSSIDPLTQTYFVADYDRLGPIKLKRLYSSTTVFRGHFGAGWCSELDAQILLYAGGENRYRACDLESAQLIERRAAEVGVVKTATGFRLRLEDGTHLFFASSGYLDRLVRADAEIKIRRDSSDALLELVVVTKRGESHHRVETDSGLSLIKALGANLRFDYREGLLVKTNESRFGYDDLLNMTSRMSAGVSEAIVYDEREDRVVQIARSAAFGRERLLLAMTRTGKSGSGGVIENGIEMKIEVERGAEMRPVRILYNRITGRLSLEGDRDIARVLMNWIRA